MSEGFKFQSNAHFEKLYGSKPYQKTSRRMGKFSRSGDDDGLGEDPPKCR